MPLEIETIIQTEAIWPHFQPIASISRKKICAVEALARGVGADGSLIPPGPLFEAAAKSSGVALAFERLCRKRALETFKKHFLQDPDILLFLNFDVATLDLGVEGSGHLLGLMKDLGIPPQRVVIEIVESKVKNLGALQSFIRRHRKAGSLVALDDIGTGHSNLDRIALLKPDILKIDASLIRGIESDFYKQEVFKALSSLSQRIGAMVLAEGVESASEAMICLELGAEYVQGFHLARPSAPDDASMQSAELNARAMAAEFRDAMVGNLRHRRRQHQCFAFVFNRALACVSGERVEDMSAALAEAITQSAGIEQLFVLDAQGLQVAGVAGGKAPAQPSPLFHPHDLGTDHSMKDYYYLTYDSSIKRYTTEPHISLATGRLCVTLAGWFRAAGSNSEYMLGMDVRPDIQWKGED